jgi:hypothetical protein
LLTVLTRSDDLSRLVKTESAGKDRLLLEKGIVVAIRELTRQTGMSETTRDMLAYIAFSLISIGETIDESVTAWEKRGYWVKADRYRMEWSWATHIGDEMKQAILTEEWGEVARLTGLVAQKLSAVKVAPHNRIGTPWTGSYKKLANTPRDE